MSRPQQTQKVNFNKEKKIIKQQKKHGR